MRTILSGASALRRWVIMASTTSKKLLPDWPGPHIGLEEFAARLAARRAELGNPELPRNSGDRRTASKRALLKAIEESGGRW